MKTVCQLHDVLVLRTFPLLFHTATDLDENRVPDTCRVHAETASWQVPRKLSFSNTTLQLVSMKAVCKLQPQDLAVPGLNANRVQTSCQLTSMKTVCQLHVMLV